MKIILKSAALAALLLINACGKDEASTNSEPTDEQAELLENTPLEVNTVSDNVIILGGSKIEGENPVPNGAITLDISNTAEIALLDEGFDISFSSDADVKGAYIQFKSKDGSLSDSYYDVNLEMNNSSKTGKTYRRSEAKKDNSNSNKVDDARIDLDFNSNIEPGEFCYTICVYDGNDNISDPQELCVVVQSWGGKSEVVGNWELEKIVYEVSDGPTLPGVDNCTDTEIYECATGEFEASDVCTVQEYYNLELKADGFYVLGHKDSESFLKEDESIEMCSAVYQNAFYGYDSNGKWAYDDIEDRIILIEYSGVGLYDGETENYNNEPGEGEIYWGAEGDIKLQDGFITFPFETSIVYLKK